MPGSIRTAQRRCVAHALHTTNRIAVARFSSTGVHPQPRPPGQRGRTHHARLDHIHGRADADGQEAGAKAGHHVRGQAVREQAGGDE